VGLEHGRGQAGEPLARNHHGEHHGVRDVDEESHRRQERARDGERHHDEAHEGDRERVGDRRDEGHLLEERDQHGEHADRHRELLEHRAAELPPWPVRKDIT